nr:uncharacterized protein LOC104102441 [Nicotiana tomentosiformis]
MTWFNDGDRNTKFFHAHVNRKRKRLQLKRIQNSDGDWIEDKEAVADEAVKFFQAQFHEDIVPSEFGIIDHVPHMVDMEQNQELLRQPTREEVKQAVYGLNGDNARGPDGFNGSFFHSCWDIVGDDLVEMVKGRSIVENVLLTQEIITNIRLRTKAGPNIVIKLDVTKAYDRLSWIFLTKILRKIGFAKRFIGWVFGIISNNWYSVLINGQPHGFFKSTRGVKQGDPLSPVLFILASEAMSRGLNALNLNLYFCGFGLPKWSPKINHLAYTNDTIIFSSSCAISLRLIMKVLTDYEVASVPWRKNGSHVWRNMIECKDHIRHQIAWQPKMGSSLFWFENWTGLGALYFITPPDFFCDESVQNVWEVVQSGAWDDHR